MVAKRARPLITSKPGGASTIGHGNLLNPPGKGQGVEFAKGFGQRALLTVDVEEEFDWNDEFKREGFSLDSVRYIGKFQEFCEGLGICPVYLIDWPVANSPLAQDIIGSAAGAGRAEVGVQLHPWVNPPYDEEVKRYNSFAGNLPPTLEREKFHRLRDVIEQKFGVMPRIYRAGRYGLGPQSVEMLTESGIAVDTSVRARFDYSSEGGPDYSRHNCRPWWSDKSRKLIELPLTTVYWGMLRQQGEWLFPLAARFPRATGIFSRLGLLERISLTPEGVSREEALRGVDIALDEGLQVLVLSFHSPSLAPGFTPYVRNEEDLDGFYDWLRAIYGYFDLRGVRPTSVEEIINAAIV